MLTRADDKARRQNTNKGASIENPVRICAPLDNAQASLPGDHSVGVPPDPIPNSAVKPDRANGTTAQAVEE